MTYMIVVVEHGQKGRPEAWALSRSVDVGGAELVYGAVPKGLVPTSGSIIPRRE